MTERTHPFYQAKADADRLEQERLAQAFARADKPQFPAVVLAEDMHRECVRDGWQMAPHPILRLRGSDHD